MSEFETNKTTVPAADAAVSSPSITPDAATISAASIPKDLEGSPLGSLWDDPVHSIATLDVLQAARELNDPIVLERHRIYCELLMALVARFWNGNNRGPIGLYPWREAQRQPGQGSGGNFRYRGDCLDTHVPDPNRVNWDRYLGHNIACLAVDGRGEIIDFDFNHNHIFRSSVEHAESRVARRLFSLTNINDTWHTGDRIPGKSRAFSLQDVTIYTSLESCAQCSGIMSLARVKQVVYLQNDPGQYRVGNIMFNLAGEDQHGPLSTLPVPASLLGMTCMQDLNLAYADFVARIKAAQGRNDAHGAYFCAGGAAPPDFDISITSFLCTDRAREIFARTAQQFLSGRVEELPPPERDSAMTNAQCLRHALQFYQYADIEGFRGTPHKL
jgi:tRNA(Arg) A34 adenosine deaminase TadA